MPNIRSCEEISAHWPRTRFRSIRAGWMIWQEARRDRSDLAGRSLWLSATQLHQTVSGKPTIPEDTNPAPNTVAEGAAVNTTVGITAQSTFANGSAGLDYSLSADSSGGGFKIDHSTGVVTVADPSKIDFESAPGHAYTITVLATKNNNFSSEQTFTISVSDIAPSAPVHSNAAANTVLEGAANGTLSASPRRPPIRRRGGYLFAHRRQSGGFFNIDFRTGVVSVADGARSISRLLPDMRIPLPCNPATARCQFPRLHHRCRRRRAVAAGRQQWRRQHRDGRRRRGYGGRHHRFRDRSGGPAPTYSLTRHHRRRFPINASTGVVTVADRAKIDYESTAPGHAYTITVQATNGVQPTSRPSRSALPMWRRRRQRTAMARPTPSPRAPRSAPVGVTAFVPTSTAER